MISGHQNMNSAGLNTLAARLYIMNNAATQFMDETVKMSTHLDKVRMLTMQNTKAINIMTQKEGGSCKYIQAVDGSWKCCMGVASRLNESLNALAESKAMIQGLEKPTLGWLTGIGSDWTTWLLSVLLPIGVCVLIFFCIGPPMIRCVVKQTQDTMKALIPKVPKANKDEYVLVSVPPNGLFQDRNGTTLKDDTITPASELYLGLEEKWTQWCSLRGEDVYE